MENKSLFSSIVLALALVSGFFFYDKQISELEQEITTITQEYNHKLESIQFNGKKTNPTTDISALEDLNNQLISARSALKKAQDKLSLANSKTSVLGDEISQITDSRSKVNTLKDSLHSAQEKLQLSDEKLTYLKGVFKKQNKVVVGENITRIEALKETSTSIAITGLIVPAVGVATLIAYTTEEIQNYCNNIKNTMDLETKVFGKVISLDATMQKNYYNQCIVSLKDKLKKNLEKIKVVK